MLGLCLSSALPIPSRGACPPAAPSPGGVGLLGTYYKNMDFTEPMWVANEAPHFDWGLLPPVKGLGVDDFSVRWTGKVVPRYTDMYTFYVDSDDGARLWVNGVLLINNWTEHLETENQGTIGLTAGQAYDLVLEYYDHTGRAVIDLKWSSTCEPKGVIPKSQLLPGVPECPSFPTLSFSSDFNSGNPVGMTLFGGAKVEDGYLKLTSAQAGQFGIAYLDDFSSGLPVNAFRATFKAALFGSTSGAVPGDGFSFNLVPAAGILSNPGYGQPAEEGLATGLSVNFDTYDNGASEAPAIDLKWQGQLLVRSSIQASQSPVGITDPVAASREVVIDVEQGGVVSVSYGGRLVFNRIQTPYNPGVIGTPKWVLGARTGAANDNHWIDDLQIVVYTPVIRPITGLFNTGVDVLRALLPDGAADSHYRLHWEGSPLGTPLGAPLVFREARGYPIGPWVPDDSQSAWISPTYNTFAPPSSDGHKFAGHYVYETDFDLSGFDPTTAVILGRAAVDDWAELYINGELTPEQYLIGFGSWSPIIFNTGFRPGINTLRFDVYNTLINDDAPNNPTGLRVEMCGWAVASPPEIFIAPKFPNLAVSWAGKGFMLQTAPQPFGPWTNLSQGASSNGVNFEVVVDNAEERRFFRLLEVGTPPDSSAASNLLSSALVIPGDLQAPLVPAPELGWFDPGVVGQAGTGSQAWVFHFGGDRAKDVVVSLDGKEVLAVIQKGPETPFSNTTTPRYLLDEVTGVPRFVNFTPPLVLPGVTNGDPRLVAEDFFHQFPWMFGTGDLAHQLLYDRTEKDLDGGWHVVFRQIYGGLSVWGCELRVHLDSQLAIGSISGRYYREPDVDLTPVVTQSDALNAATANWVAVTGSDQMQPGGAIESKGLVIFPSRLADAKGQNYLAWWFRFPDAERFVSAATGEVVGSLSRQPTIRKIYDLKNQWWALGFLGAGDLQLENGTKVTTNPLDPEAVPADTGVAGVESFWALFGWIGWDNHGADSVAEVNADFDIPFTPAVESPNAMWNGFYASFSRGFAEPDVVAHELTHALVSARAGLVYAFESGAMNESFADVFGKIIFPTPLPWVIGAAMVARDLQNPFVGNYANWLVLPNTIAGDSGGVHSNSGIGNRAAVLIADGNKTASHPGLGRAQLAKLWWETLPRLCPWSSYIDLAVNASEVTQEFADKMTLGVALPGATTLPRTFTQGDPPEVRWAFKQVGLDLQLVSGWYTVPGGQMKTIIEHQGELTSCPGQTVSDVIVRIYREPISVSFVAIPGTGLLGELSVASGMLSGTFGGGVVTATITQHGVGTDNLEVHVNVSTANYSDVRVEVIPVVSGACALPTDSFPTPTVHHWFDIGLGRKYDDVLFEGVSLPANCTVATVQIQLMGSAGEILATAGPGAAATDGSRGANIESSAVGGQSLEVRVHSWHNAGTSVRYRLIYWITGNGCSLPAFTQRPL